MPYKRPHKRFSVMQVVLAFLGALSAGVLPVEAEIAQNRDFNSGSFRSQDIPELAQEVIRKVRAVRESRFDSGSGLQVRCATGIMIEASALSPGADLPSIHEQLLARPSNSQIYDSPAGLIRLHYDVAGTHAVPGADQDSSGTPDFIERMALIADSSWTTIVTHLGYLAPPVDDGRGGDDRYDIYFQNINAFGFTQSETAGPAAWNDFSSYIVCHNTFQGFPPNDDPEGDAIGTAKASLAHEIFHAVQFGYDKADEFWFMESSAGWMEEIVFDETNDNYNVLPDFFARPEVALTSNSLQTLRVYGTFIWALFLSERFDTTLLRQVWEGARFKDASEALADTLQLRFGVTRDEAYSEFVTWLHLSGQRDDGTRFSEGAGYPNMNVSAAWNEYPVANTLSAKSPAGYASGSVRFSPGLADGDLKLSLDGFNGRNWSGFVISTRNQIEHEIKWFTLDSDQRGSLVVNNFETYDELTLVALNLSIYTSQASFVYSAEIAGPQGVAVVVAGDSVAYTLAMNPVGMRLANLSATEDSFAISISASGGWTFTSLPLEQITLQAGLDSLIVGRVIPPAGTLPGAISVARLRANSLTNPSISDSVAVLQVVSVKRGDPNWDGRLNIADVTYLISRLFHGGAAPAPEELAGDPDCNGKVNIGDVVFIIARLFTGGPAPPCQPIDPLG
ncbi:MAG: hypothetical protein IH914_05610 [candidate division Zixibacteria bacterium]|nr:hypothetical protein [candidate division Zixibacteria bacterium]